jgi:8-oxo-dGTP diphosphatase
VTAAVIERDGKVLIAKRGATDRLAHKWEFPGGKIEPGETPEECLRRELYEEFGVNVQVREFICSNKHDYDHVSIELLAYRVSDVSGDPVPKEHDEIRWVRLAELAHFDFADADLPIVETLTAEEIDGL